MTENKKYTRGEQGERGWAVKKEKEEMTQSFTRKKQSSTFISFTLIINVMIRKLSPKPKVRNKYVTL